MKYFRWLGSIAKGDFGFSLAYNGPAGPIVSAHAKSTLLLTGTATIIAWFVALPLGLWSAARPGKVADIMARGVISTFLATPDAVLAILLLAFAVHSGFFPAGGMRALDFSQLDFWSKCKDLVRHFFLPTLCLVAGFLPLLLSHVRASVIEVLASPFIASARAHGIPSRRLLLRHALPAAANPLIALLGFSVGLLLSSSVVVEGIFGWPGLGHLLVEAILERDFIVVVDSTMLATLLLLFGNLLADVLLYAIDPRIRAD
jgi:peptide/nickel transport system permease protein